MNSLPFPQQVIPPRDRLCHQTPHVRTLDTDAAHKFGRPLRPEQIDFRLSRAGDVAMRRFDEAEAVRTVDDDHRST